MAKAILIMTRQIPVLTILVLLSGCSAHPVTAPVANTGHQHLTEEPFFALMNLTRYNYQPLDFRGMVAKSDLIVTGQIASVADGRTIDFASGPSNPIFTSVLTVSINKVLKGDRGARTVQVEVVRAGAISSEELADTYPSRPMVLFLSPTTWSADTYRYAYPAGTAATGATLYSLRTPQGLVTTDSASPRLIQPLDNSVPILDQTKGPSTLDQLAHQIAAQGISG